MKVTRTLRMREDRFFDLLADSVRWDIETETGVAVSRDELKRGYRYKKKMKTMLGHIVNVAVEVVELGVNDRYLARFVSDIGSNQISYTVTESSESQIRVTYEEHFEGVRRALSWNYRLMGAFVFLFGQRRILRMLRNIERSVKMPPIQDAIDPARCLKSP